jgi:CcmD family protein
MKKITALLFLSLFSVITALAQENEAEMAFDLRRSGKIYVVICVIVVVFAGIAAYLFSLDRRLKKVERGN